MKHINIYLVSLLVIFLTSCEAYQSSNGGSFFGGISGVIDYGISEWEKYMPADSYDHTLIDAWKSGTGGKTLVLSEIGVGVLGEVSGKDVSRIKRRIHNAAGALSNNETYRQSDINNWTGALFTLGDEFIDEYNQQRFDDAVARLTDPNAAGYNEEETLRVSSIDYENRKIIWKSDSEYFYDLIQYRKSKNENWVSSKVDVVCGISFAEYDKLSPEARQEVDIKILQYEKLKEGSNGEESSSKSQDTTRYNSDGENHKVIDYASLIDGIVVSEYNINSYILSEAQQEALDSISDMLKDNDSLNLVITGHTCILGSENVNYAMGLKRANAAKKYLMDAGIDGQRIMVESLGFSDPIADNSTETGRKHNRRLTFKISNQ